VHVGMPHFENWATLNRILKLHATEEYLFPYNVHSTIQLRLYSFLCLPCGMNNFLIFPGSISEYLTSIWNLHCSKQYVTLTMRKEVGFVQYGTTHCILELSFYVCTYQLINWPIYINWITTGIVSSASDICHFTCTFITKYCHGYIHVMITPHSSCKYIWIHHPWVFYNYFSFTFIIYSQTISAQILHTLMCSTLKQLIHTPCFKVLIK